MSTSQTTGFNSRYHRLDASQTLSPTQLVKVKADYDIDSVGVVRSIAPSMAYQTSIPSFGTRDFFACFEVRPAPAPNEIMLMDCPGGCLFRLDSNNVMTIHSRNGGVFLGFSTATFERNKYSVFSYERTNGVGKVFLNGELVLTTADAVDYGSNTLFLFAELNSLNYYTFVGDIKRALILNTVPTDEERAIIHAGGLPVSLSNRGITDTYNTWIEQVDVNNLLTVSGNTFTKLAGDSPGYLACMASLLPRRFELIRPKDRIKITYNCTLLSGNASDLPLMILGEYGTLVQWFGQIQPGRNSIETPIAPDLGINPHNQYLSLNWSTGYGAPSGPTSFTFDIIEITRVGTVAYFDETSSTPSGCMIDKSGNNHHFTPNYGMFGISDATPQECVYDATLIDTSIGAGAEADVAITLVRGQSIRTTDYVSISIANLPTGLIVKKTQCVSTGVVTVTIHNLNNTPTSTGAIAAKVTQHIN